MTAKLTDRVKLTTDELDRCGPPVCVFTARYLSGMRFELRPVSGKHPPEGTVAIMYRRKEGDIYRQAGVGVFKPGEWRSDRRKLLQGDDLYWAAMVSA